MKIEAASGMVLVVATIAALIWANSPWVDSYHEILELHLELNFGSLHILDESVEHLINDGLMAIFFFVVGVEIKRELVAGELRDPRAAALPSIAALGGMIVPAGLYVMLNPSGPELDGWGIPMATDIAFALGVMSLLGNRVPNQLKLFLLTLAIVDDVGAIAVIAIFYTSQIHTAWLITAMVLLVGVVVLQRARVWDTPLYVIIGIVVWYAVLESGIHATIAGVALGFLTPARPLQQKVK
ncbi:MAG: Na+/H+ antiporter NhaA, partial [Acidimicrobiales bacterium]